MDFFGFHGISSIFWLFFFIKLTIWYFYIVLGAGKGWHDVIDIRNQLVCIFKGKNSQNHILSKTLFNVAAKCHRWS